MTRKAPNRLSPIVEHHLRTATPGRRRSSLFERVTSGLNEPAKLEVWAPLFGFQWAGTERKIGFDTKIVDGSRFSYYNAPAIARFLSQEERDECRETPHWLWFTQSAHSRLAPGANANAFLLALWVARQTPTYMRVRFHHNDFGDHGAARVLDRFTWIGDHVSDSVQDDDLDYTARILPGIRACYLKTTRLRSALTLTARACTARDWQVAFMSFTAAMTALLRHAGRSPLTDKLARAYTHLVLRPSVKGAPSAAEFTRLHRIGTQLFVGRAYELRDSEENLENLKAMADACRLTWGRVLESARLRNSLEGTDIDRARLFASRTSS